MSKIQSASSVAGKETIYVDVDDEITAIIDKIRAAKGKVVALVLPKRATVLQSVVNMKLLKRTAEDANKNLVLVTSEAGLMPLAGSVGLHVADTPTSKPSIPPAPIGPDDDTETIDEPLSIIDHSVSDEDDFDTAGAASKSVGELAAAGAVGKISADDIDESIELGDEPTAEPAAAASKPKKNKKLAVPNFDSFRKKLLLAAGVLALLIVAWIFAFMVLPRATVTIHTDSSTISSNTNLVLDTSAKTLNTDGNVVPAVSQSQQKTDTVEVPATGQQNNGQKASGSASFSAKECFPNLGQPDPIPVGTSMSSGGLTYIVQESVSFNSNGHITGSGSSTCATYNANNTADIQALKGGANYNTSSSANFSVSGRPDVSASGSATGGTDDIVKIVAQSDIDGATAKIKSADSSSVKQQLVSALQSKGLYPVQITFLAGDPQVTTSAKAGDTADNVTVTAVTTYTMLGVHKSDLQTLVDATVTNQLDKGKQVILDDGVNNATFSEPNPGTPDGATVAMQTKSLAGPQIDIPSLKKQLIGKKSGDVKSLIKQTPGVTSVDVHFSPVWVSSVPKNTSKLTIRIDKSGQQ